MRAVIEIERDGEGRLVGALDCSGPGRQRFTGLMELVGLLEDGMEAAGEPPTVSEGEPPTVSEGESGSR